MTGMRLMMAALVLGACVPLAAADLLLLDERVADRHVLLDGLSPETEVVTIAADEDLSARLASLSGTYDAVHVVAHGAPGIVFMGNRPITATSADVLAPLASRLGADAQVLLWSCYSGQDRGLLDAVASVTGTGVAASNNLTGRDGDWELEVVLGGVAVTVPFALTATTAWQHNLQPVYVYQVAPGGTLDINPLSQLIPNYSPTSGPDRVAFNHTTVPGTTHGLMYRISGVSAYVWGSGAPNPFQPFTGGSNDHIIFAGQGFRYEANATAPLGFNEDIPITVRDGTGFNAFNATLRITIANVYYPVITQQPTQNPQTNPGMTAVLQVAASIPTPPTTGTLQYQWFQGISPNAANPVGGQTTETFTWNVPSGQALGQYFFWCRVTLVGQGFTASQTGTVTVTNNTATVQSLVCNTNPTNLNSIQYQLDFAAAGPAVGGLTTSNFGLTASGVTGASVTSVVSGLGGTAVYPTWFITVNTGTGDGTIRLNLNNATGATIGISGLPYTSGTTVTIDKTRPVVSSINRAGSNPTNAASVSYTVTFSEDVTGVTASNFTLETTGVTGASVGGVTGTGATRTVTVNTGSGNGTIRLRLNASLGTVVDAAGNQLTVAHTTGEIYNIDKGAPTVLSIVRADANPTAAASVNFTVTFSEAVNGVAAGNFTLGGSGITGASVGAITGTGATRNVVVDTGTGTGTLTLLLSSLTPAITDGAGNTVASTFLAGEAYTIDRSGPVVVSITRDDPSPASAATLSFTVTFDEAAIGVAIGNFSLDTTGAVSGASITGVTGTGTTRTVTVDRGSGEGDIRLDLTNTSPDIEDALGNVLTVTFNSGEAYTIDLTPPGIGIATPDPATTNTGPVDFVVTYTDAAAITLDVADVTLGGTGGLTGTIAVTGTGLTTRTVTVSDIVGIGTLNISLAAGTATDAAGNAAAPFGPSDDCTVLGGPPTISIGTPSAALTAGGPVTFEITYGGALAITLDDADVSLTSTGTVAGTVAVSGTGLVTRVVTISGITGGGDFTISIAADTASNGGGNAPPAGPSDTVEVDNTPPILTAAAALTVYQSGTYSGSHVADTSDTYSGFDVQVAATTVPTGLTVSAIAVDAAGEVTATISVQSGMAPGSYVIGFTATDEAGNTSTADLDIEVLANAAPTITDVVDQDIAMNADTGALSFDVDDADEGPNALVISVNSDNQVLVDLLTDVAIGGSGGTRTVTITPQTNHVGVALITVTVTDSVGASSSTTFVLTVSDTADAPVLDGLTDLLIFRDTTAGPFAFTATDPQGDGTLGAPMAISSDQSLVANASIVITGSAPDFEFTITPEAGVTGEVLITFWIDDGTHTASRTIAVNIVEAPAAAGSSKKKKEDCSTGEGAGIALLAVLLALVALAARRTRRA